MKKRITALLVTALLLTSLLISCKQPEPAYTPTGEIYTKTSVSVGDAGVSEVVDMEIEKAIYSGDGEITVPVKIGAGHHPNSRYRSDGETYGYLEINIWLDVMPKDEPTETLRVDFPDWETAKFNSTEPEEKPWYLIAPYYYGEFYPLYHETVDWVIPEDVTYGFMSVTLHEIQENGNHNQTESVRIDFERVDGGLIFSVL